MGCGALAEGGDGKQGRANRWGGGGGNRTSLYGRRDLPPELANFALREQAERIFILADKDKDGKLNLQELRDIMHRPDMAEQALQNYDKARRASIQGIDDRVALYDFLQELKRMHDISPKVAEKMLFIYEKMLKEKAAKEEAEKEEGGDGGKAEG